MTDKSLKVAVWKRPALLGLALVLILAMLRLAVWQLDRASQKQTIVDNKLQRSQLAAVSLASLDENSEQLRFRSIEESGQFLPDKSVFVDRQVVKGRVGYQVFTPFVSQAGHTILVARGWVSVGDSRAVLPVVETPTELVTVRGRLNLPPPQPPLWNEDFAVFDGPVWQYLPLHKYASQMQLNLFPLVLELAPATAAPVALEIDWPSIDDQGVGKHKAYALQWFAMAIALLIMSLLMLLKSIRQNDQPSSL